MTRLWRVPRPSRAALHPDLFWQPGRKRVFQHPGSIVILAFRRWTLFPERPAITTSLLAPVVCALRCWRSLSVAGSLWAVLVLVVLFGPPGLLAYSQSAEFCAACHVMRSQHDSWVRMGKHREKVCVECHLPNRHWAPHLLRMGVDGTRGTASFLSGIVPDPIRLSAAGRRTVQENCIRCHAAMVSRIDASRTCWDCHRRSTHTGAPRIAIR